METINKVRNRHLVHGQSISQIARDLNLSRNTVKKYIKDNYPLSYRREKQPQPLLGSFHPQLLDMLKHDAKLPVQLLVHQPLVGKKVRLNHINCNGQIWMLIDTTRSRFTAIRPVGLGGANAG